MSGVWRAYRTHVERWSARERLAVFAASIILVVGVVYGAFIEPVQARRQSLTVDIQKQQTRIDALNTTIASTKQVPASQPTDSGETRARLAAQISEMDEAVEALRKNLVAADRVTTLLRELLRADTGVQLVSLRTLAVVPLLEQPQVASQRQGGPGHAHSAELAMYKHGVELTVRGDYDALYRYMTRLERSPARMFWWRVQLRAEDHPRITLVITIYTLSTDKTWLQV